MQYVHIGIGVRSAYAHIQRVSLKRLTPVDFPQDKQHSLLKNVAHQGWGLEMTVTA